MTCLQCGAPFEPDLNYVNLCSERCRENATGTIHDIKRTQRKLQTMTDIPESHPAHRPLQLKEDYKSTFSIPGLTKDQVPNQDVTEDMQLIHKAVCGLGLGSDKQKADQKLIALEIIAWGALALRKNCDYGSSVWERPALDPSMSSDSAIKVRMSDKLSRLQQLEAAGTSPHVAESLEDTYRDLGIYCLLKNINPNRKAEIAEEANITF